MPQVTGSIVKYPARASFIWYCAIIAAGSLLLLHPVCRVPTEPRISVIDAAFTATSATCVTGLSVRSTENDFSFVGQVVIVVLIQLGGIGIMTVTTFAMFQLGGRESLRNRALLSETLGAQSGTSLIWVLRNVILMTALFEGVGFVLLAIRNLWDHYQDPASISLFAAIWNAVFHSISAFCNAGFSLHDDSLMRYQADPLVNGTICLLIIIGGIGFPVMLDLLRNWHGKWRDRWDRLHLHSKMMLIGTGSLLTLGTFSFLILEWNGVLGGMPWPQRVMVAFFQSVTCRTAGFNTVEISSLTNASLFISILLMMIGAGPCSTGGGFKVSTVMVLVHRSWSTFHGFSRVNLFRRTLPREIVERATATVMLFSVVAMIALTTLLAVEQSTTPHANSQGLFMDAMFEVVSALGTVGLSTGLTTHLNPFSRVVIIVLMFLGRLGPISVFIALSRSERRQRVEFPPEEPMIG